MTAFDCPRCGTILTMTDRHGIEIDYCPQCRGVWLDRGELDKILDRVAAQAPAAAPPPPPQPGGWTQPAAQQPGWAAPPPPQYRRDDDDDDHRGYQRGHYGKPRKHWLSELFD